MKKKPDKKKTQLLEDFLELGEKCNIKIVHDKGDFNGDNCLLFSNDTIVINGNGLDEDVLNEANLDEVETVLALTNDDEDNLMVSVLVEKFSKNKRTMALVNKPNYSLLQSSLKIDDLIDLSLIHI